MELLIASDNMRTDKSSIHVQCSCECKIVCGGQTCDRNPTSYSAHLQVYDRLTNLWISILCEKDEYKMWHMRDCLLGSCTNCGVSFLKVCL